jgi:hypothetical protein
VNIEGELPLVVTLSICSRAPLAGWVFWACSNPLWLFYLSTLSYYTLNGHKR